MQGIVHVTVQVSTTGCDVHAGIGSSGWQSLARSISTPSPTHLATGVGSTRDRSKTHPSSGQADARRVRNNFQDADVEPERWSAGSPEHGL
jgi:hypothetical protein